MKNRLPKLPTIGLGLAALGRPGYINLWHGADLANNYDVAAMEAQTHAVLDAAWAGGVRYFDVARSYGKAEQFLASWLASRQISTVRLAGEDSAEITIGSKWGYTYSAEWQVNVPAGQKHEIKSHTLPVLERQIAESQALLGEHLNIYHIHSATLDSGALDNRAVLNRLGKLREEGVTIGLSTSGPNQADTIREALNIAVDGVPLFGSVQTTWNVLEPSAGPILQAAHAEGWLVIIKEAVANGRLTTRNADLQQRTRLDALAAAHDTTIDAWAIAAILQQPWVDIVLSGAATAAHLNSNLQALTLSQAGWDVSAEINQLRETPAAYWQTRSNLQWN